MNVLTPYPAWAESFPGISESFPRNSRSNMLYEEVSSLSAPSRYTLQVVGLGVACTSHNHKVDSISQNHTITIHAGNRQRADDVKRVKAFMDPEDLRAAEVS